MTDNPLFDGIEPADREKLLSCIHARKLSLRRGEALWLTGDPVPACAFILSGALRSESVSVGGERTGASLHGPGSILGDVIMSTRGGMSPVDIFAASDAEVLLLPGEGIMGGCERRCPCHDRLRENLLSAVASKYWILRRHLEILSAPTLRGRLARRLLAESAKYGSLTFSLGGTREDLASELNANRSALSRELSHMRADGLIDFYRDSFRIVRPDDLRAAARSPETEENP